MSTFTQNTNMTLRKSNPFIFYIKVEFSELPHCEQRLQPITMVVQSRRHVRHLQQHRLWPNLSLTVQTHQIQRWRILMQWNTPRSGEWAVQYSGWIDKLWFEWCLILARIFSTWRTSHKLSHFSGRQCTKICFWKHFKWEIANAVTESYLFDQHCLVWQFDQTFMSLLHCVQPTSFA